MLNTSKDLIMEDIRGGLSDQHHVRVNLDSDNVACGSDAMSSTRSISVAKPGAHNALDKKHTFSSLPLYQQEGFHYYTGHSAVFPQVSSPKYNDIYSGQYPFEYNTMAVDMTNRSNNVDTNARNPNGIVETSSVRETVFTDDRLHVRDLNIPSKLSRIKYGKHPDRSSLLEQQYVNSDRLSNLSSKNVSEYMDNTSDIKDDESGNRKCKGCKEETEGDDANMVFSCGGCDLSFYSICKLHAHIKSHNQSGSYFYSELTKTAYPKFGTCCTGSQTEECDNTQECLENTKPLSQKLGSCSTGTQTVSNRFNKKHTIRKAVTAERILKTEDELVSSKEENLRMRGDDFVNEMEVFEEKTEIKVEKDDFEEVAVTHSSVNPDSDTDEYTPDETVAKNWLKGSNSSNEYGKRKKCKVGGTRKLKQLKMSTRLRQEDRKDKRTSFVTKERNQEAVTKGKKVVEKVACKLCGTSFLKKLMLRQHIKAEHLDVPNICLLCSSSFPTNDKLVEHRKTEHNKGCHQCELCDKVLSTKGMLEGHYLIHKGIKPFSCVICVPKKEFTRKCQLKAHMDTHSTEKMFQCEFCGKPFNARYLMLSHVKHCGGIKPHKCDFCEMSFVSNHCLQRHRRTHTGEKPFICEVCAFASSNASCLARHMRIHTGEKPFICQYCEQTFAARGALKKHVRIHTQEKPYKCRFCSKAFTQNWNLKTHERQHTGETPYKCHVCGVGYKQNVLLKTHLRTHFPPSSENSETHLMAVNPPVSQCQTENQSVIQNQSLASPQTGSKPENISAEFANQQHSKPQLVGIHGQPLVPNALLSSFLHPGYNTS